MSTIFRFKASRFTLSVAEISALRTLSSLSISEIQRRAMSQASLLDIPVFSGAWPESRPVVTRLLQGIESGGLPLAIYSVEVAGTSSESEEQLSVEQARQRLQYLRELWLEQDMQAQLKEGHISSPGEYKAPPENED